MALLRPTPVNPGLTLSFVGPSGTNVPQDGGYRNRWGPWRVNGHLYLLAEREPISYKSFFAVWGPLLHPMVGDPIGTPQEVVTSATWVLPAPLFAEGGSIVFSDFVSYVTLGGGTDGVSYDLIARVGTSQGRNLEQTITIVYGVALGTHSRLVAHKSVDEGLTWAAMDLSNSPSFDRRTAAVYREGSTFYAALATQLVPATNGCTVALQDFHCDGGSPDTWGPLGAATPFALSIRLLGYESDPMYFRLIRLSTGILRLIYHRFKDGIALPESLLFADYSGGAWVNVDSLIFSFGVYAKVPMPIICFRQSDNQIGIFFDSDRLQIGGFNAYGDELFWIPLSSDGIPGASVQVTATGQIDTGAQTAGLGVHWDGRPTICYRDATNPAAKVLTAAIGNIESATAFNQKLVSVRPPTAFFSSQAFGTSAMVVDPFGFLHVFWHSSPNTWHNYYDGSAWQQVDDLIYIDSYLGSFAAHNIGVEVIQVIGRIVHFGIIFDQIFSHTLWYMGPFEWEAPEANPLFPEYIHP